MKFFMILIVFTCISVVSVKSQSKETDTLFDSFHLKFSPEALKNAKLEYEQANDTIRAIMRQYYSLPMSSRAELVANFETKESEILDFVDYFKNSVPKGYQVYLEVRMDQGPLKYIKDIDMQILKKDNDGSEDLIKAEWGIHYPSVELDSMLDIIHWDPMTFSNIKNLMQVANCISIQNYDDYTEVGFARSGLGKYSYLIFSEKILTVHQILKYNDDCEYKYYKKNIVLQYEGGMAGPQCFTD